MILFLFPLRCGGQVLSPWIWASFRLWWHETMWLLKLGFENSIEISSCFFWMLALGTQLPCFEEPRQLMATPMWRNQVSQPTVMAELCPTANIILPALWVSHLESGSPSSGQAPHIVQSRDELSSLRSVQARLLSKINGCCHFTNFILHDFIGCCHFKPLSFGVVYYAGKDNHDRAPDKTDGKEEGRKECWEGNRLHLLHS